ncbi:NIF-domain-containing protein [Amylocystis lapponica]|nr:NIF-domain-containing protein [Amylocystis lapponica]
MNSLTYLSRQFDVLASPRAPPSTPVSESPPLLTTAGDDQDATLKRVRTWSTRSFLVPLPGGSSTGPWSLKRSFSSPAVNPAASAGQPAPTPHTSRRPSVLSTKRPSAPPSRRPSVSAPEKAARPPSTSASYIRRIYFVRIILLLWNSLYAAWRSITRQRPVPAVQESAVEDGTDEEEKDTEDESRDEKTVLLHPPEPPFTPAIPSLLSSPPASPIFLLPPPASIHPIPFPSIANHSPSESSTLPDFTPDVPVASPTVAAASAALASASSNASRSSTPSLTPHKRGFHQTKTLVLDLDETLIHSTSRPMYGPSSGGSGLLGLGIFGRRNKGAGHMVEVVLNGRSTLYHVYKRPFVDYFLRKVSGWYTLVIFTASMQEYADPVIDWLDAGRGILARRLFRESCTQLPNGSYTKDLSIIEEDLARICLIDNSPVCYSVNEANGIPIEGWTHDPHDEALLDLLPVLDSLRFTSDVRHVLGIRGFS